MAPNWLSVLASWPPSSLERFSKRLVICPDPAVASFGAELAGRRGQTELKSVILARFEASHDLRVEVSSLWAIGKLGGAADFDQIAARAYAPHLLTWQVLRRLDPSRAQTLLAEKPHDAAWDRVRQGWIDYPSAPKCWRIE